VTHSGDDWLGDLARQLAAEPSQDAIWERVVRAAVSRVAGAEHASITLLAGKSMFTAGATDDLARTVDLHQYATGEGPCLTSMVEQRTVIQVEDLRTDLRWAGFRAAVNDLSVRAVLSVQLYTDRETIGALNLYAGQPNAFTGTSIHTATALAAQAAVAASTAERDARMHRALASREVIGQAEGILMERHKITAEQALAMLAMTSQHSNRKLRDVAADLVETGDLAGGRTGHTRTVRQ
jgi:transcriptional regulator with GAF, ATPase, and Fis domain